MSGKNAGRKSAHIEKGLFYKLLPLALAGVPAVTLGAKPSAPSSSSPTPSTTSIPAPTKTDNQFFSWYETGTPAPIDPAYIGTPFLRDDNASAVNMYLSTLPAGAIRAVKVQTALTPATTNLIFNNGSYNVSYVFGDLEGANAVSLATTLRQQVQFVNGVQGGTPTMSNGAFIGNFGFSAQGKNNQLPTWTSFSGTHSDSAWTQPDKLAYSPSGMTMSTEDAYPGSPSMRSKGAGDTPQGSGAYPNIRGQLFTLPLWRMGQVTDSLQSSGRTAHAHVPWISNFNNWGNLGLDNDRDASNKFTFKPGVAMDGYTDPSTGHIDPALGAAQTANQMLSKRDFAALVTHARLRGADSFHLLDSGVIDNPSTPENEAVSRQQMQLDAKIGWLGEGDIDSIVKAADKHLLIGKEPIPTSYYSSGDYSGGSVVWVDGAEKNVDQTGAIFSGAYSLTLGKLDILISNLDDAQHTITLPATVGGYALATKDFLVAGGDHKLVEYTLGTTNKNKGWSVASQHVPYTALANSRNGFGIPEPGTLTILSVAGILALNRRRARA